eukprot:1769838-Pyramimonas_sp.AAC.1
MALEMGTASTGLWQRTCGGGTSKLDRLCGARRLDNGRACVASTPFAQLVVKDFQSLAEICEDVANWHPQRHPDISMFHT